MSNVASDFVDRCLSQSQKLLVIGTIADSLATGYPLWNSAQLLDPHDEQLEIREALANLENASEKDLLDVVEMLVLQLRLAKLRQNQLN